MVAGLETNAKRRRAVPHSLQKSAPSTEPSRSHADAAFQSMAEPQSSEPSMLKGHQQLPPEQAPLSTRDPAATPALSGFNKRRRGQSGAAAAGQTAADADGADDESALPAQRPRTQLATPATPVSHRRDDDDLGGQVGFTTRKQKGLERRSIKTRLSANQSAKVCTGCAGTQGNDGTLYGQICMQGNQKPLDNSIGLCSSIVGNVKRANDGAQHLGSWSCKLWQARSHNPGDISRWIDVACTVAALAHWSGCMGADWYCPSGGVPNVMLTSTCLMKTMTMSTLSLDGQLTAMLVI